jgi:hypothetical protein
MVDDTPRDVDPPSMEPVSVLVHDARLRVILFDVEPAAAAAGLDGVSKLLMA